MIEVGAEAPDFSIYDHELKAVSLAHFAGRKLVLAFYPADFSPLCSDQLSIYQEVLGEIRARDAALALVAMHREAWDDARSHIGKAIKLNPSVAEYHYRLGNFCFADLQDAGMLASMSRSSKGKKAYLKAIHFVMLPTQ